MTETRGIGQPRAYDWRDDADCRKPGMDPELWFPAGTSAPYVLQMVEAKAFCYECPVALTCALWAIEHRMSDGIFGGLTESQRRKIQHKRSSERLTSQQTVELVHASWRRDARNRLVDTYLARTIQGDDGHVWWRGTKTSVTTAGRTFTPGQLAFEVGQGRAPEGPVKATCGQPYCVASEHLADGRMRWRRDHGDAA